jgi:UDP-N-acetylmuramyl pentapeptide phosphotransferase/UDP-N-acetylglucosamine-1-phosphate transferase
MTRPSTDQESRLRRLFLRLGFLATPKDSDRRRFERQPCSFPVQLTIRIGDQDQVLSATALDLSIGGMLVEGVQVPDGVIRTQVQFEIPDHVFPEERLVRSVRTSAAIRYRDQESKTLSLSFAEGLHSQTSGSFIGEHWLSLVLILLLAILVPLALWIKPLAKYIMVWGLGFGVTLMLTPLVRWAALKLGAVDVPDERRTHRVPTPRGGGLAVVIGFYAAALLATSYTWEGRVASMHTGWLTGYLLGSAVLVLVGILDDLRGLRPFTKLSGQLLAAGIMFALGHSMGRLLGFALPWWLDMVVTLVWFVALTNAFNLIDGLDGLATGLALVAGLGLMGAFFLRRMPGDALVLLGLIGACMAFLRYNFHPASIFLGDTGSMFLGFTFASIALSTGSKGTFMASLGVPLLAVGIPVFDTILAIWRRSMRALVSAGPGQAKSGLMQPDAEHLHHRLRKRGLSQYQVAVLLYVFNGLLVLTGLLSMVFRDQALGIFLVAFVAGAYVVMRHLAEVELWDTGRAIIQGLHRPQQRVAAFLFYPVFDVICLILALGIATLVVQLVEPVVVGWESWIASIPIWVAPVFLAFCLTRIYSRVWSLARTNDYLLLSVSLLGSVLVSLGLSILIFPDLWKRFLVQTFVFTGVAHVLVVGSRMFLRGLLDGLAAWGDAQYYRRGGVVRRVLLYGSGGSHLLYLRERALNAYDAARHRLIVGLVDDDANLRSRRVGGFVVLGGGTDLAGLVIKYRIDELIITGPMPEDAHRMAMDICRQHNLQLSQWHREERVLHAIEGGVKEVVEMVSPKSPSTSP